MAFCAPQVVPGIDFSDDRLLQRRLFSYLDTELTRLSDRTSMKFPSILRLCRFTTTSATGFTGSQLTAGACPFEAGAAGFISFPDPQWRRLCHWRVSGRFLIFPSSPVLSIFHYPGIGIHARRIAILFDSSADNELVRKLYSSLLDAGAVPRLLGGYLCCLVEITSETARPVLFGAVIISDAALVRNTSVIEFVRLEYRHDKPIMALGNGKGLLGARRHCRGGQRGLGGLAALRRGARNWRFCAKTWHGMPKKMPSVALGVAGES